MSGGAGEVPLEIFELADHQGRGVDVGAGGFLPVPRLQGVQEWADVTRPYRVIHTGVGQLLIPGILAGDLDRDRSVLFVHHAEGELQGGEEPVEIAACVNAE
jgi:hypothetical protein